MISNHATCSGGFLGTPCQARDGTTGWWARARVPLWLVLPILSLSLSIAPAADLYWNGVGNSGSAGGGGGTWNATNTNWETAATGGTPAAWGSGDNGFFAGTAGTVDVQSSVVAGTLTATTSGYTVTSTNGSGLTLSGIDISSLGANGQLNVGVRLTGSGPLSLAGAGDTSTSGGGNANLGIRLTNTSNDFVGDVTITSRLVSYTSDAVFGDATNAIVMNGGGLLDNNVSVNLARDIEVQAGGGLIRLWNTSTPTWSGTWTGSGPVSRTDTGVLTLSGNLSGYSGTYTQGGAGGISTVISGGGAVGGNWVATNGAVTFNSGTAQSLAGTTSGSMVKSGAGVLTLTNASIGGNFTVNTGGGLVIDGAGAQTLSGLVSGAGSLTKTGSGTLTSTARNTTSGPVTVSAGTLQLNDARSMTGAMTVGSGATLTIQSNGNGGYYQPASLDVTNATVNSSNAGANRYHGIYTEVLNVNAGSSTISVPLFMDKNGDGLNHVLVATVASGGTGSISSAIANHPDVGGGGLTKAGAGVLTLTGGNIFTGNVIINAGTLNAGGTVNNTNPTGTSLGNMTTTGRTVTVNSGATLSFISSDTIGQYNYASPVMLIANGGTITRVASANTFNSIGSVTLRNGGRLTTTNGNASTVGSFAINGSVTVDGTSGSFIDTLAGQTSNSYINLGTGTGSTTFTVASTGDPTADLTVSAVLGDQVLSGAASLIKAGAGTMRVTAGNGYSGGTTVRAGTLVSNNNNGFGSSGSITLNDGSTGSSNASLLIDASAGTVTLSRPITVANLGTGVATIGASANAGANFATFSGAITLGRSATLVGPGAGDRTEFIGGIGGGGGVTVNTSGGTRIVFRGAANSYAGATTITAGSVLQLSDGTGTANSFLADTADVTVNGTLNLAKGTNAETIGGLLGNGTVSNLVGGVTSTLIVGNGGGSGTFSGVLSNPTGTLALTKTGSGAQVLSGSSGFSGVTSVTGGRLEVASTGVLSATSGITVNGVGAEFRYNSSTPLSRPLTLTQGRLSGTGTIATAVAAGSNVVLSPGNSPGAQAFTSGLTWNAGGTYDWELNSLTGTAGTQWDLLNVTSGGLNLSGLSTSSQFNLNLITLDGTNAPGGLVVPYAPGSTYEFLVAGYTSLNVPSGFSSAAGSDLTGLFAINLTGWAGQQPNLGDISVRVNGTGDGLTVSIVPEPGALALLGSLAVAAVVGLRWSRVRSR